MSVDDSRPTVAIAIPIYNGMPLIEEVVQACAQQGADELIAIDSGSTDGSIEVAKQAGFRVIEIPQSEYGHGRTRNQIVRESSSEVIIFITQDATPVEGFMDGYLEAFATDKRVGLAFGPHLPRPETSPMVAREQLEFWRPFSPNGEVTVQHSSSEPGWHPEVLSNANAAYRRDCIEQVKFRDVNYAEDRAVVIDAFEAGWAKAYAPRGAVLHAHDYPKWTTRMRRYFDEYRGLLETTGYRTSFYPKGMWRDTVGLARQDRDWLATLGVDEGTRKRWHARSFVHHGGRRVIALAGGRADKLPGALQKFLSLEGKHTADAAGVPDEAFHVADVESAGVSSVRMRPQPFAEPYSVFVDVDSSGAKPVNKERAATALQSDTLDIALLVSAYDKTSPTHAAVFNLIPQLERMGHRVQVRVFDPFGHHRLQSDAALKLWTTRNFCDFAGTLHIGLGGWQGADVVVCAGWDAGYASLSLSNVGARATMHFVDPIADSTAPPESEWSKRSLSKEFHVLAAGVDLSRRISQQIGRDVTPFELAIESETFKADPSIERRDDTLAVFLRPELPWVCSTLARLSVAELVRRNSGIRVVATGTDHSPPTNFSHRAAGFLEAEDRVKLFSEATVGLILAANDSLPVQLEMLACGLPTVALQQASGEQRQPNLAGIESPYLEAPRSAQGVADCLERLFNDPVFRAQQSAKSLAFTDGLSWSASASEVVAGLRLALAESV